MENSHKRGTADSAVFRTTPDIDRPQEITSGARQGAADKASPCRQDGQLDREKVA